MPTPIANRPNRRPRGARRERSASDQPGNSFDYLYWRLSEGQFQKMVSTILREKFDPVRCYPIGMGDEGIDAITHGSVIYQVKWSSKFHQNPETWLSSTIEKERAKIRKLADAGRATRYVLVTSVAGTTTGKGTGSIQKLDRELERYSEDFGIPIECWWQSDIDAEINRMGDGIKWSFQEMLSGSDAIRYLIFGTDVHGEASRMRRTLMKVIQAQWRDDSRIRFSQAELDGVDLLDLFVDVRASLVSPPGNGSSEQARRLRQSERTRPAAATLLTTKVPLTFLLGVPGQGKSTLTQYLCQQHRAAILASEHDADMPLATLPIGEPKLPLRVELKTYAEWIDGFDPFDDHRKVSRRRSQAKRSVEMYIAQLCSALSGGRNVSIDEIHSLLERYPTLLVFDGLDEVANPELRAIVVDEIERLISRMGSGDILPTFQLLVTSRPNSTNLAEPDPRRFQTLRLEPLSDALQMEYVVKWCDARGLDGPQRNDIRRIFRDRTSLDHVAKLADNPMQLTILLYLISKKGDAVPVARTPLYSSYMETLLDREVAGGHIGRNAAPQVEEVTAFLGWHMQAGVESTASAGTMTRSDLENTILLYLNDVEAAGRDAAELFRVATDRFWALTSKVDGLFEFAVQPVREYFAARFLAQWAGRDLQAPLSKEHVLTEMLGRSYWLNTLRFYAGFATPNELGALRYGLEEAMSMGRDVVETRVAAWTLLADAVFVSNPRMQRDVVRVLTEDHSVLLLALDRHSVEFTRLTADAGGQDLIHALTTSLAHNPQDTLAPARIDVLKHLSPMTRLEFREWWTKQLDVAIGTNDEARWLELGSRYRVETLPADLSRRLTLADRNVRRAAIGAGVDVPKTDPTFALVLQSVLEVDFASIPPRNTTNEATLLAATMRPEWFHEMMRRSLPSSRSGSDDGELSALDRAFRNSAWQKLVKVEPRYQRLREAARLNQSHQGGTTEPWGAPARELAKLVGASWLAAEIAISAAAAPHLRASGSRSSSGQPFGDDVDYGNLISEVHAIPSPGWWLEHHQRLHGSLAKRTWAVALLAAGSDAALSANLPQMNEIISNLDTWEFEATAATTSRIALNGATRTGRDVPTDGISALNPRTRLLLAHFGSASGRQAHREMFTDAELAELAAPARSRWPIAQAIAARVLSSDATVLRVGISKLGPESLAGLLPVERGRENVDLARSIIGTPAQFSVEWLRYSHEVLSGTAERQSFEKEAVARKWVPRIPRYT